MKFLIRMAIDISTNIPTPASWDVEVEAEFKRAAARKFRRERGFQRTEPLFITEVPMKLNREQLAILDHTAHRAAGGFFCGDSQDMQSLVAAGLMESAGRKSFVPDEYFRTTNKGREALRSANPSRQPPAP